MAWEKFIKVLMGLSTHFFGRKIPAVLQEDKSSLYTGFRTLTDLRQLKLHSKPLSFFDLVLHGKKRQVREAVDRIYAIYGMVENVDKHYRNSIRIDYTLENRRKY